MARARYQVLVIPYCIQDDQVQFCLFRRSDMGIWQFIAGGGEEEDLSIIASAKREAFEEAGISKSCDFFKLNTCCSIPTNCFKNAETIWGKACFVIPEYAFAVRVESTVLQLSHEHTEYNWLNYAEAHTRLQYDSNKTALWEVISALHLECWNRALLLCRNFSGESTVSRRRSAPLHKFHQDYSPLPKVDFF